MRRRLTTLRAKQGHSQNGAPRALIDLAVYREHRAVQDSFAAPWDPAYSGWTNARRPRDFAISLRNIKNIGSMGPSVAVAHALPADPMPEWPELATRVPIDALRRYQAQTDEAVQKGAVRGRGCLWPDPAIRLANPQTPAGAHWVHMALQLTAEEAAAVRPRIKKVVEDRESPK